MTTKIEYFNFHRLWKQHRTYQIDNFFQPSGNVVLSQIPYYYATTSVPNGFNIGKTTNNGLQWIQCEISTIRRCGFVVDPLLSKKISPIGCMQQSKL